jgi:hypothetical protein
MLGAMVAIIRLLSCVTAGLLLAACGSRATPSYFLSHHPDDTRSRPLSHYPVARQGDLSAWLASDHVLPASQWLYAPGDTMPRHRIVGVIRAGSMPEGSAHDGAFLVVSGYDGPLFDLWEGTEAKGRMFTGSGGWLTVQLRQGEAVNTWVRVSRRHSIGGWSGFPVVIGDPARPEAVAGAMWYKSNTDRTMGGATSTRMLKRWLGKLRLADFVGTR